MYIYIFIYIYTHTRTHFYSSTNISISYKIFDIFLLLLEEISIRDWRKLELQSEAALFKNCSS